MTTKREPTVPLQIAEVLRVTLETSLLSAQVEPRTRENITLILAGYKKRRDDFVKSHGYDDIDIGHFTEKAAESLANWLDDRAHQAEVDDAMLDMKQFEDQFDAE